MTLTVEPTTTTTSSGSPLPLVALPQGELLTINDYIGGGAAGFMAKEA